MCWLAGVLQVFSLYNEAREFINEAESRYDCQDFHVSSVLSQP
jgi:hypothetical protein